MIPAFQCKNAEKSLLAGSRTGQVLLLSEKLPRRLGPWYADP